jgi:hypothetical protein
VRDAPAAITSADCNGDRKADLAVPNFDSDTVAVVLNTTPFPPAGDTFPSAEGKHHHRH